MAKKVDKKAVLSKGSSTLKEFRDFISRGNVLDMAVGVIIGAAFGKIVTSVVSDILMPLIGCLIGGLDFTGLTIEVDEAVIYYGRFIQNVIDFLIVAACIFFVVKVVNKLTAIGKKEEEAVAEVKKDEQIVLLEEIRDLLKKNK